MELIAVFLLFLISFISVIISFLFVTVYILTAIGVINFLEVFLKWS